MKVHTKAFCFLLILAVCIQLLAGCATPEKEYSVRFTILGKANNQQTVKEGAFPYQVNLPQGVALQGWLDETGNKADPFSIAITKDISYTAIAYPILSEHTPYLFTDADGFLYPDDALTADALQKALRALAAPGAENFFPTLPSGIQVLDKETLRNILENFFEADAVQSAFAQIQDAPVTRLAFALIMNNLLGRNADEHTALTEDSVLPRDLDWSRADIISLLEASVIHSPAQDGKLWDAQSVPSVHEPGFLYMDGWLYYINEDGSYLRNGAHGALNFGENGRYTCGDEELDAIVAPILADIQAAAPDADPLTWLRSAYEYSRDSFDYLRRNAYEVGDTGWEIEDAKKMFTSGRGNCYSYAAAFWALARGLGYEARAISGTCLKDYQPHGWVFIEIDGEDYLFDPEWEMVYREERDDFTKDMFMLPMEKIGWWSYRW